MGIRYLVRHWLTMAKAEAKKEIHDAYVAECLRVLTVNSAGVERSHIRVKYQDLIKPKTEPDKDPAEIVDDIKNKLRR